MQNFVLQQKSVTNLEDRFSESNNYAMFVTDDGLSLVDGHPGLAWVVKWCSVDVRRLLIWAVSCL